DELTRPIEAASRRGTYGRVSGASMRRGGAARLVEQSRRRLVVQAALLTDAGAARSGTLRKAVQHFRVLHQDAVSDPLVGSPVEQKVEQDRVVRLVFPFSGMRP